MSATTQQRKLAALLAAAEDVLASYEKALAFVRSNRGPDAKYPMAYGALSAFMPELADAVKLARGSR